MLSSEHSEDIVILFFVYSFILQSIIKLLLRAEYFSYTISFDLPWNLTECRSYYLHLTVGNLRHREVKSLAQGCTAGKWQSRDFTPGMCFSQAKAPCVTSGCFLLEVQFAGSIICAHSCSFIITHDYPQSSVIICGCLCSFIIIRDPCSSVIIHVHSCSSVIIQAHSCSFLIIHDSPCSSMIILIHPWSRSFVKFLFLFTQVLNYLFFFQAKGNPKHGFSPLTWRDEY